MKTILHVILILMISDIASYAQKVRNLDEMNEKKRNEYLIKKTKKVVMRFGPGYYRDKKTPVIKRVIIGQNDSISAAWMLREHKGRVFYAVYLRHDPQSEYMHLGYAARVFFWADTGVAFEVMFGNSFGVGDIDKPEIYNNKKWVIKYKWQAPSDQLPYFPIVE